MASTRAEANDQVKKAADIGREVADQTARAARNVAEETANAGEQALRTGSELTRRSAETAQQTMQSGLRAANEVTQRVAEQFRQALGLSGEDAQQMAQQSSQNIEAITEASNVLVRGAQDISKEWVDLARDRLQKNIESLNSLGRCRSVQDVVALQTRMMRDNLMEMINTGRRLAELSLAVTDDAAKTMTRLERAAERTRRAA